MPDSAAGFLLALFTLALVMAAMAIVITLSEVVPS